MAKVILKDASITVNGIDLSTRCSEVAIEDTAEEIESTAFQGNGYKEFLQGLKDATITATFQQDYASGSVHSTLNAVYQSGAAFDVVIKADDGAVSATNPSFTMNARLYSYSGVSGAVGQLSTFPATFRNADDGITVATSP